ncbi:MAG: hypothetical protein Q8876_03155, partial [Bacillota bacterium]|nr:hypothetical protein [Bacillota bacterium]
SNIENKKMKILKSKKFRILFIEGTHENFDALENFPIVEFGGSYARQIADNIFQLMRGQIYKIEGKLIFTFGGGEIPDKVDICEGNPFFLRQMPTKEQIENAAKELIANGSEVNYIITHEPPNQIAQLIDRDAPATDLGSFFLKLTQTVKFEKWFFGALHADKKLVAKYFAVFDDILPIERIEKTRKF